MAIGIKNLACKDCSKSIGSKPKKVVSVVNKIGRKRRTPASTIACRIGVPLSRERLMKSTKISESLTTIPVNAIIPKTLMTLKL